MKRVNNIYNKICDINVIMDMYDKVIKTNTKNKKKIQKFENFYSCNMAKIKETLITKSYLPGKYNIFLVKEPKTRIIMSQEIEDKIVNHLVAKYFLIDVFDKTLQDRNCATRKGKGTHYALRLFKKDYNYLQKLKLTLNAKTKVYSSTEEIEFLGFVFYNKGSKIYMKLTNKTKKKFKEKMKIKNFEYINNNISKEKYLGVRNSYRGHLSCGNCYSLYNKYVLCKL